MSLIHINNSPTARELKWFGLLFLAFAGVLSAVLRFAYGLSTAPQVVLAGGAAFAAVYYAVAPLRRRLYVGWLYIAMPIGAVVSIVLLAATYFLVITPVGLLVRWLSHDPMTRRFDPAAGSYWVRRPPPPSADRYFRQF